MFPIRKLYKIHEISIPEYEKNGVKRWGLYVVRKGTIYTAHIYICTYVFTSSTYNSACGDLEGARVSEAPPPPHENSNFLNSRTSKNSKKIGLGPHGSFRYP